MRNESLSISNFLWTGDAQSLAFFERLHKRSCLEQAVVRTHVEPDESAAHSLYIELISLKICADDVGDLQFATAGRLKVSSDIDRPLIAKIETCYRPIRTWHPRLFFDRERATTVVELDDTVAVRIIDVICENGGTGRAKMPRCQQLRQP